MAIEKLYKSHIPYCKFIFSKGKEASFIGGRFHTAVESEISELDAEVASNHPFIFTDAAEPNVDTEQLDPMEAIKKQVRAELLAEAAAGKLLADSSSVQSPVLSGIATSKDVAEMTQGARAVKLPVAASTAAAKN